MRVSCGPRILRRSIITSGHFSLAQAPQEKSPRHCCLGLNPPMEEVEETSGSNCRAEVLAGCRSNGNECRAFFAAVQYDGRQLDRLPWGHASRGTIERRIAVGPPRPGGQTD